MDEDANINNSLLRPVATLVPTKSDADLAADLKCRIIEVMPPIFALLDDAKKDGFIIQYQVGQDAFGRHCVTSLIVAKHY